MHIAFMVLEKRNKMLLTYSYTVEHCTCAKSSPDIHCRGTCVKSEGATQESGKA